MQEPFFSVIIPAYNRANIILNTIESVTKQTFTNYEIVVVDDGSKDNTKDVIAQLNNPKVKYIYQTNAERSAARNNGARNAKGQYLCFLDSDDFYLENHLETLYKHIQQNNFDEAMYFVDCKFLQKGITTIPQTSPMIDDVYKYFLVNSVVPVRVCVHKNIFSNCAFAEDIVIVEDTVMWCNIATKYKIHHIQMPTVLYHLHDDNSVLIEKNCFLPRLKGLQKMFAQPQMHGLISKQVKNEILSDCYFGIARHYEFVKKFWPMLYNTIISLFYLPTGNTVKKKLYMIYAYIFGKPSNNY